MKKMSCLTGKDLAFFNIGNGGSNIEQSSIFLAGMNRNETVSEEEAKWFNIRFGFLFLD